MRNAVTSSGAGTTRVTVSTAAVDVANVSDFPSDESRPMKVGTSVTMDCPPAPEPATVVENDGPISIVRVPSAATLYVNSSVVSWTLAAPGLPRETNCCTMLPVPSALNVTVPWTLFELTKLGPIGAKFANPSGGVGGVVAKFAPELTQMALPVYAKSPLSLRDSSPIADDANINMTSAEFTALTVRMMPPLVIQLA